MKEKNKNFVNLGSARVDEQRKVMEIIVDEAHCPFCPENLKKYHKEPIIKEGAFWLLTKNQWPYENTTLHFLAIYKTHAEKLSEIEPESFKELGEFFQWVEKEYKVPGGGFAMRFGDMNYSGGTVSHIHSQFIQADIHKKDFESVRIKIGLPKNK